MFILYLINLYTLYIIKGVARAHAQLSCLQRIRGEFTDHFA